VITATDLELRAGSRILLSDATLRVQPGDRIGLVGRNGAGKTTTLKSIIGLAPPRSGRIILRGRNLAGLPPFRIARLGIGYVPEDRRIFGNLSVRENLEVARTTWGNDRGRWTNERVVSTNERAVSTNERAVSTNERAAWTEERVFGLFPHLGQMRGRQAGRLSGGEQQMLTIARTLMGSPEVLLLDEPSEGLAPLIVQTLGEQLRRLKGTGLTMVLAEQNLHFVSELGDRVYILEKGLVRYQGTMAQFLGDEEVRRAHLAV
jgi:branched-chain amino acid transport system ATP-binding protein